MAAAPASLVDLLRKAADPYGYAFGLPRPFYGYRPGWPYQPLPRPARNPPSPPAFVTPRRPGWSSSGWNFGSGGAMPPGVRIGTAGLHNWIPAAPPPVRL